jgi:hypothetical protein
LQYKRKLSTEDFIENKKHKGEDVIENKKHKGEDVIENKKHKGDEGIEEEPSKPLVSFNPRPRSVRPNSRRGKSVKLAQRSVSRNDIGAPAASVSPEKLDAPTKSNDDFRALLFSKKNEEGA